MLNFKVTRLMNDGYRSSLARGAKYDHLVGPRVTLVPDYRAPMHGAPGGWTLEQFISTLRTGVVPDGRVLNADVMPWQEYAGMTDEELQAIWLYLGALGGEENTTRAR